MRLIRTFVAFLCGLTLLGGAAISQEKPGEPVHAPVKLQSPLQDKNFYLLSMIERSPAVRAAVNADPALARIASARMSAARQCCEVLRYGCRMLRDVVPVERRAVFGSLSRACCALSDVIRCSRTDGRTPAAERDVCSLQRSQWRGVY